MLEKTHKRSNQLCVLCSAWFAWAELLAGIAKTATGKACNECKTLGQLGLDCVKILGLHQNTGFTNRCIFDSGDNK